MSWRNPTLIKNFSAEAAIAAYRIVKFGADDDSVVQAAAVGDSLLGVVDQPGGAALGDRCDVVLAGITEVEFGGIVARGGAVTTDADGKAVAAAPATGVNNNVIGYALVSAVSGDVAPVRLAPHSMQGA